MIRRFFRFLLTRPIRWLSDRYSSAPKQQDVMTALSELYKSIIVSPGKKGELVAFKPHEQPVIIFSDQHKGARNGSDDFTSAEKNYIAALDYYNDHQFYYINLGDSEELWENTIFQVMKHNKACFKKEQLFVQRKAYCKIYGNHDLFWDNDPLSGIYLKRMYKEPVKVFSGIVLRIDLAETNLDIFCTHGHQGDAQSDGNAFSKWFVSNVWGPLQSFLRINPNTPSTNDENKTMHNQYMYEWSAAQNNTVLITGHTHQPVFNSLTHLERLYLRLEEATVINDKSAVEKITNEIPRRKREYDFVNHSFRNMKPSYFNSGCCCFEDGTITGIEIADGFIRLVKWGYINGASVRTVAEEASLETLSNTIISFTKNQTASLK